MLIYQNFNISKTDDHDGNILLSLEKAKHLEEEKGCKNRGMGTANSSEALESDRNMFLLPVAVEDTGVHSSPNLPDISQPAVDKLH